MTVTIDIGTNLAGIAGILLFFLGAYLFFGERS